MRLELKPVLPVVALIFACACEPPLTYSEPPSSTFTVAARQLKTDKGTISVQSATVTSDFFRHVGLEPLLGRFIVSADEGFSSRVVAVLSHDLWTAHFSSSPEIIGRHIELDGQSLTVVGVAQQGFRFPGETLVWTSKSAGVR